MEKEIEDLIRKFDSRLETEIALQRALIALQLVKEKPEKIKDKVILLSDLGLTNKEIALILNISEKHVAKEKSLSKRRPEENDGN